jgi:5-methylcytosine-specific restriction endonuclease McrA
VSDIDRITADVARRVDLFCGEECLRVYDQSSSASALRRALFTLERGVCVECKLDCDALVKKVRVHRKRSKRVAEILRLAPAFGERGNKNHLNRLAEKPSGGRAWECDHKIAVFEGGGTCSVENTQTLCVICHAKKTKIQAKERAMKRKRVPDAESIRRFLPSVAPLPDSSDSDCVIEDAADLAPTTSRGVARSDPVVIDASSDDDVNATIDDDDQNLHPRFTRR